MKRRTFIKGLAGGVAGAAAAPGLWSANFGRAMAASGEIKVGVLFDLTGTIAVVGRSLHNAALLAIDEINAAGGVNGMQLKAVVRDGASDPATYAAKARELVMQERVVSIFGSYTSASRKAVLPVVEQRNNLYWYPTLYEGRECSGNVMYGGAVPNQQQRDFIPWLVKNFGKRFYLIGSNYIYPKIENDVCKMLLEKAGGEVVGEEYVPLGHSAFGSVLNKFRRTKPNVVFSTVVGDSVIALHRQYKTAGFDPAKMPMASLTTSEVEVAAMGGDYAAGHFTSAPYFMGYDSPENHRFVEAYQAKYGKDKVTHFVSEAAYFQVFQFKKGLEKLLASGEEITPTGIRNAARGQEYKAPQGLIKVDARNDHTYLWPKIGEWQTNGQAKIIQETETWVEPKPYWPQPGVVCTPQGVKQA